MCIAIESYRFFSSRRSGTLFCPTFSIIARCKIPALRHLWLGKDTGDRTAFVGQNSVPDLRGLLF
ncbi:hypothetical protein CEK71_18560 [Methylovulum psychrotolerans]|uniref:Uncharacterized protein n=1 Tax=Methylovulum psychrotolerans TaxID=1704499 RepID=A0A1Z4C2Y2_9GAMM|nr:hypothetical protein CEK71_18560 [Methylovulum psychrotolerans]